MLATLDRRELEIQIQQAEAEMDRLQSKVRQGTIGILTEDVHWRVIFYINLPTGVLSIVSGYYLLPRRAAKSSAAPLDLPGLLTMTVASVALLLGLNLGHELGWGSRLIAACSRFRSFRLRFSSSSSSSLRSRFWNSGIFAT